MAVVQQEREASNSFESPSVFAQLVISINRKVTRKILSKFVEKETLEMVEKISQMEEAFSERYPYRGMFESEDDCEEAKKEWASLQEKIGWEGDYYLWFCEGFYREMKSLGICYWNFDDSDFTPQEKLPDSLKGSEDYRMYEKLFGVYNKLAPGPLPVPVSGGKPNRGLKVTPHRTKRPISPAIHIPASKKTKRDIGVHGGRLDKTFWTKRELKVNLAPLPDDCRPPFEFTKHTVIDWANRWRDSQNSPVPKFIETTIPEEADIRVKFVGGEYGGSWSLQGTEALKEDKSEPTMELGLSGMQRAEMEEIVVHVFGHALGLKHEHQRSEFWDKLGGFIDREKMKNELSPDTFKDQWECMESRMDLSKREKLKKYDANSVMHYKFYTEWFFQPYDSEEYVETYIPDPEKDPGGPDEEQLQMMKDIYNRKNYITHPSEIDLKWIKEQYS